MAILKNNPVGCDIGHGVTVYNLENQVLKNKVDIQNLQTSEKVLATFGIKVIGTAANSSAIPTVAVYKANNADWEYGDAYAVGTQSPYEFYILTRADDNHAEDYWFNLGVIKGPKGDPGNDGANGADGKDGVSPTVGVGTVTTGNPGTPVSVTNGGTSTNVVLNFRIPKGEKGDKGNKGDKGDTGFAVNIASELNNVNELPAASASYVNVGYVIKDADGDSNLYVCMTNASSGAWYWNNVGKIAFSADYVSQNEYNQDKLTDVPVTLYDGGTQNTTINLKNGNGTLIGTGFGFGTINGNDILVNSNNVEGNLELVQVIDVSNYTFAEITNHSTEMFAALKNFLTTNKIRAVGVEPIYSSASKMIAATLLLKDGQFSLKSIETDGQGTIMLIFIDHGLSSNIEVTEREVDVILTYTNGVPTSLDEVSTYTATGLLGYSITLMPHSATQGTLTDEQVNTLISNPNARLELNRELYYLNDNQHTPDVLVYTHNGYENQTEVHKYISVTISTKGWVKVEKDSTLPIISGEYSAADDWISFYEEPTVNQNGGTPYTIVLQSSQLSGGTMTMPIHLFTSGGNIFGGTVTVKMGTNILNITPFMKKVADNWHLDFNAYIMNGEQAGTNIAAQLMPTLTLIGLIKIA